MQSQGSREACDLGDHVPSCHHLALLLLDYEGKKKGGGTGTNNVGRTQPGGETPYKQLSLPRRSSYYSFFRDSFHGTVLLQNVKNVDARALYGSLLDKHDFPTSTVGPRDFGDDGAGRAQIPFLGKVTVKSVNATPQQAPPQTAIAAPR